MKSDTCSGVIANCPFGFRQSLAIFASILFGAMPAEPVSCVVSKIRARISFAMSHAYRPSPVTSTYASSSESGSTRGV